MLSAKRIFVSGRFPVTGIPLLRLIPWINVLIVAMLSYSLAQLTWSLMQDRTENLTVSLPVAANAFVQKASPATSLDMVAALHLLGRSDESLVANEKAPIIAPETRLNLTLRGLVALSSQDDALAIIAQGGGNELSYKVGDTVPGGAVLHEIHADRVILERGGRFETLTLPKEKMVMDTPPMQGSPSPVRAMEGLRAPPLANSRRLQVLRDTILKNPQDALTLFNAQPVMAGGQLKGYRVNPGRDRRLFNSVGLRPGDVVTSVNGIPLNDMSQMETLFGQLSSATRLDVTVERGGQQTQLSLSLE